MSPVRLFTAVERLSAASLCGFIHEQSANARTMDHHRRELAEMLLRGPSDIALVRATAANAAWPLSAMAAVVLITDADTNTDAAELAVACRCEDLWLVTREGEQLIAIVPDLTGPGRIDQLATLLRGCGAVVGPAVELLALPESRRLADRAAALRHARVLREDPLFVGEHLDWMVVHQDARLLAALRRHQLRPLAELPEHTRERLTETLTALLLHMGNQKAVATRLHVHPQTVRYRLAQLRELFGTALDEPRARAAPLGARVGTTPNSEETPSTPARLPAQQGCRARSGRR